MEGINKGLPHDLKQNQLDTQKYKKWKIILCGFTAAAALAIFWIFVRYVSIAGFRTPIMDFFRWVAWFGEKSHSGGLGLFELAADSNEQMHPLSLAINFWVLEITGYDFWILVISGAILRCVFSAILIITFIRSIKNTSIIEYLLCVICSLAICLVSVNPNQWELVSMPFSLATSVRDLLFFGLFYYVSSLLNKFFDLSFRNQLIGALVLSLFAAAVSLLIASAYFIALLGSISIVMILLLIIRRKQLKPTVVIPGIIWAATVIGCFLSYILLSKGAATQSIRNHAGILSFFEGIILYLGASIVPQNLSETSLSLFYIAGVIVLEAYIYITYKLIKEKIILKNVIPLLLIFYSIINGFVIGLGRIGGYGLGTMVSSRYTAESLLGLVGVVWGGALIYAEGKRSVSRKTALCMLAAAVVLSVSSCYIVENRLAPYRGNYANNIKKIMMNIDDYTDQELSVCQSEPYYVRPATEFLKNNNLSVFAAGKE